MVVGDAVKAVEHYMENFTCPEKYAIRSAYPFSGAYVYFQFKVAVAVPPSNDVNLFVNDVGFIAIVDENSELSGFNVAAGGGMGVTHGNKKTYPRTADVLGFCTVEQGKDVAEKIMLVQRYNGNRVEYVFQSRHLAG
jgi:sulfite reductase (NADPH) hemoprotein beta-component